MAVDLAKSSLESAKALTITSNEHPLPYNHHIMSSANMDFLTPPALSATRLRAMQDARKTQKAVVNMANKMNATPPPYVLEELSGKGTFGRVYRG